MKNYIFYTLVLALTWAHIAPQVHKWIAGKDFAASLGCERDAVFYFAELAVDTRIDCSGIKK